MHYLSIVPIAVPIRPVAVVSLVVPTVLATVMMPPIRPIIVAIWRTHFYRRPARADIKNHRHKGWCDGQKGRRPGAGKEEILCGVLPSAFPQKNDTRSA